MIRYIYWLLVIIEVALVLAVLLLFIITDSRSIKYIAKTSLDSSGLTYESIEGSFFDGLEVRKLSYKDKPLFNSARIHWNPLTLFYDKITITQLDVQGIELNNIMTMVNGLSSQKSEGALSLDLAIVIEISHLDINPYVYKGVKFSSFIFETGKIEMAKDLSVNTDSIYLKFDSDIVNVSLNGNLKENQLFVENLNLKNISVEDITKLIARVKSENQKVKSQKSKNEINFLKEIKLKHIVGTMKAIQYGDLKIKGAKLDLYDSTINPAKNFNYQVKKVKFKGRTNFGKLIYNGKIKDSTIHAKGNIELDKKLFSKYSLPLNFKGLKKLPSSLRLNYDAVWIDIDHKIKKLLKIKSDFNLDVTKAKHKLHYNYSDGVFTAKSEVLGNMTYAKTFKLINTVRIDNQGFSYAGEMKKIQLRGVPSVASEYLLLGLGGKFKGDTRNFKMDLASKYLMGHLSMSNYKSAKLSLKSKTANIELRKIIPNLPLAFKNERIALENESFFDFKKFEQSRVKLFINSKTIDIDASMKLQKPFEIHFLSKINNDKLFKKIVPKLNFTHLQNLEGTVKIQENNYLINLYNKELKLFVNYNTVFNALENGILSIDNEAFKFKSDNRKSLIFHTNIANIQDFLLKIKRYYAVDIPNLQGEIELHVEQRKSGTFFVTLKSPKLQYLSEEGVDLSVTNIYNIDTTFKVDKNLNIEIQNYQFKLDDNGYLSSFYSAKVSYLTLQDNILKISKFWLNDKIEITGNYNIETLVGNLKVYANSYELSTKDFALILDLDLDVGINKERFDIDGNIYILGDTITYEVVGTNIVEDADIVIVKDMLRMKESAFNNFKLYIKIKSKKPLRYIAENVNIEFFNDLSLLKNYNQEMLITGVTNISKGYYQLEDKQFILDESHLYFTGDIKTPLLDIKANYEKDEYNIHVFISGTTDAPIINFNSEPYLTQQEILSLILFDGTGSSSGKGAEAYTLLGGTFAKGLIKSLGIDVDHLLLGRDAQKELSLEIGKRVSKNISVLYLHKDGLDGAKIRIEHSKSFETDIIIQPPNTSSIEFLYKQDR